MGVFFVADTHFGDDSLRRYENRPFASTDEMDAAIIERWNSIVEPGDEVYLVGDVGDAKAVSQLNGHKYLIKGNHDTLSNEEYRRLGFDEVYDHPILFEDFWIVSHEPVYVNRNMPYANIFGHVHGNPQYHTVSARSYCVCVDRTEYMPVLFESIAMAVAAADKAEENKQV